MAPRKKATEDPSRPRREEQLNRMQSIIRNLMSEIDACSGAQEQQKLLASVSLGMYEELDKLTKKAPAEQITDLMLEQVNDLITETKQLIANDPYIQKLTVFVPAGDLPEQRNVLFVLRQIRQGLERFIESLKSKRYTLNGQLEEANLIKGALSLYLQGETSISKEELELLGESKYSDWRQGGYYGHYGHFRFERLDELDLDKYFEVT